MKDKNEKVFGMRSSGIYERATELSGSPNIGSSDKQQKEPALKRLYKKLIQIPVFYCFTKEYQQKIAYREFMQKHLDIFKLNMEEEKTREEEPFSYEDEEDIPYPESWF